ncbi:hypothetical protein CYMTET_20465 [Cymbomonas tetramitiformis]|uniref:Uncharacterized protein n=1 Tax=Cymbomonas tetramitiformis TaxID=36881 RepID=A0AAE0G4P0_9CHLO|nr:hypothetical protein CYMTET_20465 [Cymbomonas tetramitiformis]
MSAVVAPSVETVSSVGVSTSASSALCSVQGRSITGGRLGGEAVAGAVAPPESGDRLRGGSNRCRGTIGGRICREVALTGADARAGPGCEEVAAGRVDMEKVEEVGQVGHGALGVAVHGDVGLDWGGGWWCWPKPVMVLYGAAGPALLIMLRGLPLRESVSRLLCRLESSVRIVEAACMEADC